MGSKYRTHSNLEGGNLHGESQGQGTILTQDKQAAIREIVLFDKDFQYGIY